MKKLDIDKWLKFRTEDPNYNCAHFTRDLAEEISDCSFTVSNSNSHSKRQSIINDVIPECRKPVSQMRSRDICILVVERPHRVFLHAATYIKEEGKNGFLHYQHGAGPRFDTYTDMMREFDYIIPLDSEKLNGRHLDGAELPVVFGLGIAAAGALAGGTLGAIALGAGLAIAGAGLLDFFSPTTPQYAYEYGSGETDTTSTYNLTSRTNVARLYRPMLHTMGTDGIVPDPITPGYTLYGANDDATFFRALNVGFGNVRTTNFQVNETAIEQYPTASVINVAGSPLAAPIGNTAGFGLVKTYLNEATSPFPVGQVTITSARGSTNIAAVWTINADGTETPDTRFQNPFTRTETRTRRVLAGRTCVETDASGACVRWQDEYRDETFDVRVQSQAITRTYNIDAHEPAKFIRATGDKIVFRSAQNITDIVETNVNSVQGARLEYNSGEQPNTITRTISGQNVNSIAMNFAGTIYDTRSGGATVSVNTALVNPNPHDDLTTNFGGAFDFRTDMFERTTSGTTTTMTLRDFGQNLFMGNDDANTGGLSMVFTRDTAANQWSLTLSDPTQTARIPDSFTGLTLNFNRDNGQGNFAEGITMSRVDDYTFQGNQPVASFKDQFINQNSFWGGTSGGFRVLNTGWNFRSTGAEVPFLTFVGNLQRASRSGDTLRFINDNSDSPLLATVRTDRALPPWALNNPTVKAVRTSVESSDLEVGDELRLTEIIVFRDDDSEVDYLNLVAVRIEADATANGRIDSITCTATKTPHNTLPVRTGSTHTAYSNDNPAVWVYDMLKGGYIDKRVYGSNLSDNEIDIASLQDYAEACEGQWTCNGTIDQPRSVLDFLKLFEQNMYCFISYRDSKVGVVFDEPAKAARAVLTEDDVLKESVRTNRRLDNTRFSKIPVRFNDASDNYAARDFDYVITGNPEYLPDSSSQRLLLTKNREEAEKRAIFFAAELENRTYTVKFTTGMNFLNLQKGDVIILNHPQLQTRKPITGGEIVTNKRYVKIVGIKYDVQNQKIMFEGYLDEWTYGGNEVYPGVEAKYNRNRVWTADDIAPEIIYSND